MQCIDKQAEQLVKKVLRLMGNRFEISVVADNEAWANSCIDKAILEISRIEKLLTTFSEDSVTNAINRQAGIAPVKVEKEVFQLIQRSLRISTLTQGAFDITYGSIDNRLWNFDRQMKSLPDAATAKKMVHLINYRNVLLNERNSTVMLKEKGMRIGFGGIGKGYAAEAAKQVLKEAGIKSGIVNAAGDLTVWGTQPDGNLWTIGIANPEIANQPLSYLTLSDVAVATSGNYEKYVWIDGIKYSHTINPKTGLPITGIKSVTVISPNAEISDALTTPVMIMGTKVGLSLMNQLQHVGCFIIDDNNVMHTTNNISIR